MQTFANPRRCLVLIEGDAVLGGDNIVGALEERKDSAEALEVNISGCMKKLLFHLLPESARTHASQFKPEALR